MFEWTSGNVFTLQVTMYETNMTLNSACASYFKDVRWVMIGLNQETKQIAIKPVNKKEVDLQLVPIEKLHKISIGKSYGRISNKVIMKEIQGMCDFDIDKQKFEAIFDNQQNILIVDIKKTNERRLK